MRVGLNGLRQLVEDVQGLVLPTPLVTRRRKCFVQSLPEAERAVAHRDVRRDRQTARLQIDKQFLPALTAFPHARLQAQKLLFALRGRTDQHQHAFGLRLHARLQIDAVRQVMPR